MQQRVFITGGASGLGFALAKQYVQQGASVCIADLNEEAGTQAQKELQSIAGPDASVLFMRCDVTRDQDLQHAAKEIETNWGGLDVLVNNAGVAHAGPIVDATLEDWNWILDINLMGVVRGCRAFIPLLRKQSRGTIMNVSSMAGLLDVPNMTLYNASKAAVVSLSETLQNELAPDNIQVSVVCPSFFRTNLGTSMRTTIDGMHKTLDKLMSKSDLDADGVARCIIQGVNSNTFYILPHKKARKLWRLKRWLPRSLYAKLIQKNTRDIRK